MDGWERKREPGDVIRGLSGKGDVLNGGLCSGFGYRKGTCVDPLLTEGLAGEARPPTEG